MSIKSLTSVYDSKGNSLMKSPYVRLMNAVVGLALMVSLVSTPVNAQSSFVNFESGQVRPMSISPDGSRLFVANTPDNRLEVFAVTQSGLFHLQSIPVGMEPVAVAARSNAEVWVVNHLSDSVSIVTTAYPARVIRTLKVGDEPRDIVFAGPDNSRAFITAANRDVGRKPITGTQLGAADVWVFDVNDLGGALYGDPITVINLFADTPRALAVSPDGGTVYAAAFLSGNKTTVVTGVIVEDNGLPPFETTYGRLAPQQGLIVKWDENTQTWRDFGGRDWTSVVPIRLPDYDVFSIDANAALPIEVGKVSGVGTVLFNMVVNPQNNKIYVSNLESRNHVRFEGPGVYGGSTVRGHSVDNRITVIDGADVIPRDLNKHIDFVNNDPGSPAENAKSLANPLQMAISSDGQTMYVAAYMSSKIGIFDTTELEDDTFVPRVANHIEVAGGGPSGILLDEAKNRLYVLKRFSNSIGIVDLNSRKEINEIGMYSPEPPIVTNGRRFLYDARLTSARGNQSCGSCHIFGDNDGLAWDLGDPEGTIVRDPNPMRLVLFPNLIDLNFHPMKGPMTTQSLRGMDNHGPMHWRGDRSGGNEPEADPADEKASFKTFRVAFEGLVGKAAPLPESDMDAFADFALTITYPPNPIRAMDNSLTPAQARGEDFYRNFLTETFESTGDRFTCNDCHVVDVQAGFFGTDGLSVGRPERFGGGDVVKIPHLRNVYTKIGNFENKVTPATGDQYRGFFINHEGSMTSLLNFLFVGDFDFPGGNSQRRDVAEFVLAMDSNLLPVVGRQVTLYPDSGVAPRNLVAKLEDQAAVTAPRSECDLIVKGRKNGQERGWLRLASGLYRSDRASEPLLSSTALMIESEGATQERTFTCVPPGSGTRMGIDRDEDGFFDSDERDAGTDPTNPLSKPAA